MTSVLDDIQGREESESSNKILPLKNALEIFFVFPEGSFFRVYAEGIPHPLYIQIMNHGATSGVDISGDSTFAQFTTGYFGDDTWKEHYKEGVGEKELPTGAILVRDIAPEELLIAYTMWGIKDTKRVIVNIERIDAKYIIREIRSRYATI